MPNRTFDCNSIFPEISDCKFFEIADSAFFVLLKPLSV